MLYEKGFLAEEGYLWSIEKDKKLQEELIFVLREILNEYIKERNNKKAIKVMKLILNLTPFDKELNLNILKIYSRSGEKQAAYNHYKWLENVLKTEYDTTPPGEIRAVLTQEFTDN